MNEQLHRILYANKLDQSHSPDFQKWKRFLHHLNEALEEKEAIYSYLEKRATRSQVLFAMLHTLFDHSKNAVFIYSYQNDFRYTNATFEKYFGTLLGVNIDDYREYFHPNDFDVIQKKLEEKGSFTGRVSISAPQKTVQMMWMSAEIIKDENEQKQYLIAFFSDLSEAWMGENRVDQLITKDALTGLLGRQGLMDRLDEALDRSRRYGRYGALFFIDLDNFKEINDTLGHLAGDEVLKTVAKRVRSVLRKSDIFGRLGGDEFLIIVEEIKSSDTLMTIANKVIEVINRPIEIDSLRCQVGVSIGIALFPRDGKERQELLHHADAAMYRAKAMGKNTYYFYGSEVGDTQEKRFQIEGILKDALKNRQGLYLLFQPQFELATQTIVALEALLRVRVEDTKRLLLPSEFIPIAERSELINELGKWVLNRCCELLDFWKNRHGLYGLKVSINLSYRQLIDREWPKYVASTLRRYGIEAGKIEFEVSEESLRKAGESGLETLKSLKSLGCGLSIDDFGVGESSFNALRNFQADRLKIDRSLIGDFMQDTGDRAIVEASITLAHALGLRSVAEGIETEDQKRAIAMLGCEEVQGYLFGHPTTEEQILRQLLRELKS